MIQQRLCRRPNASRLENVRGVPLPAKRATRAVLRATASTVVFAGVAAAIDAVLGAATWVAEMIVVGVIAVVVTVVAAYALSRP